MKIFTYSKDRSLHGILRSFYDEDTLFNNIEIYATSVYQSYESTNAFDYETTEYWYGNRFNDDICNLTFCMKNYYIKPYGFELGTSAGDSRPSIIQFASSKDNKTYSNIMTYNQNYNDNDIFYFSYENSPQRCFRLICAKDVRGYNVFDVRYLEIFGLISSSLSSFNENTCKIKTTSKFLFISIILLL